MKHQIKIIVMLLLFSIQMHSQCGSNYGTVVISEVYFDTRYEENITSKYHSFGEYIELYNSSDTPIDLNGWTISDNHTSYTFHDEQGLNNQNNLVIAPGGFKIVTYNGFYAFTGYAENFIGARQKFLEFFPNSNLTEDDIILQNTMVLFNDVDKVTLVSPAGRFVDEVSYFNDSNRVFSNGINPKDYLRPIGNDYTINISPKINNGNGGIFNGAMGSIWIFFNGSFQQVDYGYAKKSIYRSNVADFYTGGGITFAVGQATPKALPDGMIVPQHTIDPFLLYSPSFSQNTNYTESTSYDIKTGLENGKSKTYFDDLGKPVVSLTRDYVTEKVWGTETLYDSFGRKSKESFPTISCFGFDKVNFLSNPTLKTLLLDKYYSNNNEYEEYQATAEQPFSEINYDNLNPGNVINVVGGNKINNEWKTGYSYTVPAAQEMYYAFGSSHFNDNRDVNHYLDLSDIQELSYPDFNFAESFGYGACLVKIINSDSDIILGSSFPILTMPTNGIVCSVILNHPITEGKIYKVALENSMATFFYVQILQIESEFANTNTFQSNLIVLSGSWDSFSESENYFNNFVYQQEITNVLQNANYKIAGLKCYKSVTVDANGIENVSFTDSDGKALASARSGGTKQYPVTSLIGSQGFIDIHLPVGCGGTLSYIGGSSLYNVYNLKTGTILTTTEKNNLTSGFYRIELINNTNPLPLTYIDVSTTNNTIHNVSPSAKGVNYMVNYYDYALNVYDKTDRLVKQIQPNAFANEYLSSTIIPLKNVPNYMQSTATGFSSSITYSTTGEDVIETLSTDEGASKSVYRKDGQIRYSQSALQAQPDDQGNIKVSYTNYDSYGRPIESGVITGASTIWNDAKTNVDNPVLVSGTLSERVISVYDYIDNNSQVSIQIPSTLSLNSQLPSYIQHNLSSAVAATYSSSTGNTIDAITWYSYDIYGRLEWVVQYNEEIGFKTIDYQYDDRGNVSNVVYQKNNSNEKFTHRYTYDLNGKLIKVETATGTNPFAVDAEYTYSITGELKRTTIAQVQGLDYVYTLGGMLKSINHPSLEPLKDPGKDGVVGTPNASTAPDLFGLTLDYYQGDYNRSNTNITSSSTITPDYVGNIKATRWATKNSSMDWPDASTTTANQKAYIYNYNRDNWLTDAQFGTTNNTGAISIPNNIHREQGIDYDANGNINHLQRTNENGAIVDDLTYHYTNTGKNQLNSVTDAIASTSFPNDIDPQNADNYVYDEIGQLILNKQEQTHYVYNTSGLVTEVRIGSLDFANAHPVVKFYYNERGIRNKKESFATTGSYNLLSTDYYITDLSGNAMSIYKKLASSSIIEQKELPIYGLSRLGVCMKEIMPSPDIRNYQITDHLGNVRAVMQKTEGSSIVAMLSYADYYPFGEQLNGRNSNSANYRYAFQGQEKDPETGMEAFQLRLWDGRLGRWLTVDPYHEFHSPYVGMGNNPVNLTDPDGGCTKCPKNANVGDSYNHSDYGDLAYSVDGAGNGFWSTADGTIILNDVDVTRGTSNASGFSDNSLWRYTPGFGSGLDAYDAFARGDYWTGAFHSALAITDIVFLGSGSIIKGGTKAIIKEIAEEGIEQTAKFSIKSARKRAVREAWRMEKELVEATGEGTRRWTTKQLKQLKETGKVKGFVGHHINSVKGYPMLSGIPANIEFVTRTEHLVKHSGNFRNVSFGELINRSF